jgi:uncharacterized damage-inducible protein DinB
VYRRIDDFEDNWARETEATLKIFHALTDRALPQQVAPGGRSLGRLAWHIATSLPEMMKHAGLPLTGPGDDAPQPPVAGMVRQYEAWARSVGEEVKRNWTDNMLPEVIPMYGESWPRGAVLAALIAHQAHHRGQMTVLMRQAGLKVPGVYGPSREEWSALDMPPQE